MAILSAWDSLDEDTLFVVICFLGAFGSHVDRGDCLLFGLDQDGACVLWKKKPCGCCCSLGGEYRQDQVEESVVHYATASNNGGRRGFGIHP